MEAGVGASRRPRQLHVAVRVVERQPFPRHQVSDHDGGGARHAGVTVDQNHAVLQPGREGGGGRKHTLNDDVNVFRLTSCSRCAQHKNNKKNKKTALHSN